MIYPMLVLCSTAATAFSLTSQAPGNVFSEDGPLDWCITGDDVVEASIVYFGGNTVWEGVLEPGELCLPTLPRGYYEWIVGDNHTAFAVVPDPTQRVLGDSALATDAAHSWLVPSEQLQDAASLLRLAGFNWARERIRWSEVQPERETLHWGRYDTSADAAAENQIQVYQIFHDTPGWAREDPNYRRIADDLRDVYRFAREAASHFRGRVQAWEVWNEPDIKVFGLDPGDAFAAHTKAAALGFRAGDPDTLVLMPSLAHGPGKFAEQLFTNGAIAYCDLYNYHIYAPPSAYAERAQAHFELMARYGYAGMTTWLTEAGIRLEHTSDEQLTSDDQLRQAEFVPKSYVASLASGVDKHFFFVFPHYLENGIEFGVLREDLTPYPGYVALATLTYALGRGAYLGRFRHGLPDEVQAHLFDRGDGQALVLWSDGDLVRVKLPLNGGVRYVDLMGREENLNPQGSIQIQVSTPSYLLFAPEAWQGTCEPSTLRPANQRVAESYELSETAVRLNFPELIVDKENERYQMSGGTYTIEAEVYQFGEHTFVGELALSIDGPGHIEPAVSPVKLETMERVVIPAQVHMDTPGATIRVKAVIQDSGRRSAPAIAEVFREK